MGDIAVGKMKLKLKMEMMNKIIISDSGVVMIPTIVKMQEFEVAELLGVTYRALRANVKTVMGSNICYGDYSQGGVVYGNTIYPDLYGLDMVVAVSFRVQTPNAKALRDYILRRLTRSTAQPLFVSIGAQSQILS